jgi:hypothetical protein
MYERRKAAALELEKYGDRIVQHVHMFYDTHPADSSATAINKAMNGASAKSLINLVTCSLASPMRYMFAMVA